MGERAGCLDFQFRRQMRRNDLQHLREDFRGGGDDVAGVEKAFVADKVADECARLLRDQAAGGEIPGFQVHFPEAVVTAAAHVAEV